MKHEILVIAGVLAALVFFLAPASGEDLEKSRFCDQKTFANSINLKFIWIKTLSHNSLFAEEADIYNVWKKRIGFGIDTTLASGKRPAAGHFSCRIRRQALRNIFRHPAWRG
ncbi:MAG TPA: hypothetical protein VLG39_09210 [Nitrospirota bacterium]|nr:hypothetical protein [Nitrospirota bacterium]